MASQDWWRDPPRVNRDRAREALEGATQELDQHRETIAVLLALVNVLADRRVPDRACDSPAERRVLGWLLSGKCASSDFADLGAYDFSDRAHQWIFALGCDALGPERELYVGDPLLGPGERARDALRRLALLEASPDLGDELLRVVDSLPFPSTKPRREIDLVVALGRRWSVVDQTFNVQPYEVNG